MLKKLNERILVLLGVAVMLLSAWLGSAACSLWQERLQLTAGLQQSQKLLAKRQQFAGEHADYAGYQRQQAAQLAQLEAQAGEQLQLNNVMQRLQRQARTQGVELVTLQAGQGQRRQEQQLKIVAAGDFFALLRWLRQAERAGCIVQQLRLVQGAQDKAKLTMELNVTLLTSN